MKALFQEFYDSNGQRRISLSSSHLIYNVDRRNYVKAVHVNVGDRLRIHSAENGAVVTFQVSRVDYQVKTGYIAPLTREGTLLVSGVDASCYAEVNDHQIAHLAMLPIRVLHRLNKFLSTSTTTVQKNHKDISFYSSFLHRLAINLFPSYLI